MLGAESILVNPVLPAWAQWIVLIGGVVYAGSLIWTRVMAPLARVVVMVHDVQPILDEMIVQFRPNGGSSLYDTIVRIDERVDALSSRVETLDIRMSQAPCAHVLDSRRGDN